MKIIVGLPFRTKAGRILVYTTGQGIGMYSSWASIALLHHVIVLLSAAKADKPYPFNKYIILGDDVVIADDEVAVIYKDIITSIGIEISYIKTVISNDNHLSTEFASK